EPPRAAPTVQVSQQVPFETGREGEFRAAISANINDVLRDHLKAVSDAAISGPNQLELIFPSRYNFSKTYCERPESLRRLEEVTSAIAGKPIRLQFRVVDEAESAPQKTDQNGKQNKTLRNSSEPDDPFVQQAKSIFDATIIKVEPIGSTP